jgi:hypothetical protein
VRYETIPAKDPPTRIKPLAFASGYGRSRYMTGIVCSAPERTLLPVGGWTLHMTYGRYKRVTVSLLKRLPSGFCASETAVELKPPPGSRSGLKYPLELLESLRYNSFLRRRRRAWL